MSEITEYDGILRYMVPSGRGGEDYLCELDSYGGNGRCTCRHFTCRCEPLLRGGSPPSDATRCKHLKAARAHLLDQIISALHETKKAASEKNPA